MKYFHFFIFVMVFFVGCAQMEEDSQKAEPRTPKAEYTREDAGEWESIKDFHLPIVEIDRKSGGVSVQLSSKNFDHSHYIERIGIMNGDKVDLASKPLQRGDEPRADFILKPFPSDLERTKIYVKCNLHDLWTVSLSEALQQSSKKSVN